jgi:hypothetical protein
MATVFREEWLDYMTRKMRAKFEAVGAPIPSNVRSTFGFPSTGKKGRRIGECWDHRASADGHFEVIIHLAMDDPMRVAGILAHELIHAAVGLEAKHGPAFKKVALAIGLEGKMTATTEGPDFKRWIGPILDTAPDLPHKQLRPGLKVKDEKAKPARVKCECAECGGYSLLITQKWIDEVGLPHCPLHGEMVPAF